jgi:hypothetical protein
MPISHETEEYFINHEIERMWKEAAVAYFEIRSLNLLGIIEEHYLKSQQG